MINKLIEKYEKKKKRNDESYAKFKEMKNYSFMGDCETKEVIYKEIIKDLEELKEPTIYGYTIEEITTILQALELERIYDTKITMKNLSILLKKIHEDFNTNIKKQFEHMAQRFNDTINSDLVEKESDYR